MSGERSRARCRQWAQACYKASHRQQCIIPAIVSILLFIFYIILLGFFGVKAKNTVQVHRMIKAEYCEIDSTTHKSGSRKVTKCCEHWLGVICGRHNYMPCPSVSVQYKLPNEEFRRAGYMNFWDPQTLLVRYATNSHCLIVPITCPSLEEQAKMESVEFTLGQRLDCFVYSDIPERPLFVKADIFSHLSVALILFLAPPLLMIICIMAAAGPYVIKREEASSDKKDEDLRHPITSLLDNDSL